MAARLFKGMGFWASGRLAGVGSVRASKLPGPNQGWLWDSVGKSAQGARRTFWFDLGRIAPPGGQGAVMLAA